MYLVGTLTRDLVCTHGHGLVDDHGPMFDNTVAAVLTMSPTIVEQQGCIFVELVGHGKTCAFLGGMQHIWGRRTGWNT